MLVAGMELSQAQWNETLALCRAFRDGHACCIARDLSSVMATVALSGVKNALVVGSDAARREVAQLNCTLSIAQGSATNEGSRPLYGPVVTLSDIHALFNPNSKHDLVAVLVTAHDVWRRVPHVRRMLRAPHCIIHAPFMITEDMDALDAAARVFAGAESALAVPSERVVPPVRYRKERRPNAPISESMMSTIRRALVSTADDVEVAQAFSRARMVLKREADVVAEVRSELVPDRDVIVVCENKQSSENTRRALAKANLSAARVAQLDWLLARSPCLEGVKGVRTPLIIFAEAPTFEADLRLAYDTACQQAGRAMECVVFVWGKEGAFEPRRWAREVPRDEAVAALVSLTI